VPTCMVSATVNRKTSESQVESAYSPADASVDKSPVAVESSSVHKATEGTGVTAKSVEKDRIDVGVPHFVPTPADTSTAKEERKSILIVGAHPDEDRWKKRWQPLAEKYDLTFLQNDLPVSFKLTEGAPVLEKDKFLGEVAYSPDKRVEVWKIDFNDARFAVRMTYLVKKGRKFDLVINDYSVYKFFEGEFPCEVAVSLVSVLKPNGYCVLGPLGTQGGGRSIFRYSCETTCAQDSSFDMRDFLLDIGQQKLIKISWNIGSTEPDKQEIDRQLEAIKDSDFKKAWKDLIEEKSKKITVETATASVNAQLKKGPLVRASKERGWSEINPIQPITVEDIQSQLDEVLPPVDKSWNSPTSTWMIISQKK